MEMFRRILTFFPENYLNRNGINALKDLWREGVDIEGLTRTVLLIVVCIQVQCQTIAFDQLDQVSNILNEKQGANHMSVEPLMTW